jgi:subtilisin family serine protease
VKSDPRVKGFEQDQEITFTQTSTQVVPTGIRRIFADQSSTRAGDGSGSVNPIRVAVIDTGVQSTHPDLLVDTSLSRNFARSASTFEDGHGHGTHVAGTIAALDNSIGVVGVAPGAQIVAVKVLGNSGSGYLSDVIAGINYVAANANLIPVANMSLGGGYSCSLNLAVENAVRRGVVVVVAAGNSSSNANWYSPASAPSALTIAALDDRDGRPGGDRFASFSNYGSRVDFIAPGVAIRSTFIGSSYATLSGTSMASPHVAGLAALYKAQVNSSATPSQVRQAILREVREYISGRHREPFRYPLVRADRF